jgi:MFS family permease
MTSPARATHAPSGAAVRTIALASMLTPLNTSMLPVALPHVQREFGTSANASTWLLTVFALGSAVGHPLAGVLADRLGPRRVLMAGLCIAGASALAASGVETFARLVALRAAQALGTSTAFPAGIALLRLSNTRESSGDSLPAAWLGAVAMTGNLAAALGPMLGGVLMGTVGWRAIFLVNLPIALAAALLVLSQFPADRADARRDPGAFVGLGATAPLVSVCARFAAACTVFFAAFFALPLWLDQSHGLSPVATGAMMLPLVIVSALVTPVAIRTVATRAVVRALQVAGGMA